MEKILNFIKGRIEYVENQNITIWNILFSIYFASLLRAFLEGYINILNQGKSSNFIDAFFHYPLWYLGVFSGIAIILSLVTKEKIKNVIKLFVYSPFLVITPIFFDLFLNNGNKISYYFINGSHDEIIRSFLGFFSSSTIGMRLEILIGLILIGFYVYIKTKNLKKIGLSLFLIYIITFLFLTLPTLVFVSYKTINPDNNIKSVGSFFKESVEKSTLNEKTFILSVREKDYEEKILENKYSIILSLIVLFIDIFLLSWCFWIYSRNKFIDTFKNFRYLRVLSYFSVLGFGVFVGNNLVFGSFFDIFYIIGLFLTVLFIWLFAVWENDEEDFEIDKISNKKRPLPLGKISLGEWKIIKYIFLWLGLNLAFLSGFYSFILASLFLFNYHVYSSHPFRFKKIIGLSSFLVSFNILIIAWMGYFMTSGNENLNSFPLKYTIFIIIFGFLIENIKNIKDIEGDKKNGIKTIANILGEERSKLIFGFILALFCLVVPFVFYLSQTTLIISTFFAVAMFLSVNKKYFEEKYPFLIYLIFFSFFVFYIL